MGIYVGYRTDGETLLPATVHPVNTYYKNSQVCDSIIFQYGHICLNEQKERGKVMSSEQLDNEIDLIGLIEFHGGS